MEEKHYSPLPKEMKLSRLRKDWATVRSLRATNNLIMNIASISREQVQENLGKGEEIMKSFIEGKSTFSQAVEKSEYLKQLLELLDEHNKQSSKLETLREKVSELRSKLSPEQNPEKMLQDIQKIHKEKEQMLRRLQTLKVEISKQKESRNEKKEKQYSNSDTTYPDLNAPASSDTQLDAQSDIIRNIRRKRGVDLSPEEMKNEPSIKVLQQTLQRAIDSLAVDIYSEKTRFFFEMIQNADDNSYETIAPGEIPSVKFYVQNEYIWVENNEDGFTESNVEAICTVGGSTKVKSASMIGNKGIGFKSVFQISNHPHVFSNPFRFRFNALDTLGMIAPQSISMETIKYLPMELHAEGTTFYLPRKSDSKLPDFQEVLGELQLVLLFLRKLKSINLFWNESEYKESSEKSVLARKYIKEDNLVELQLEKLLDGNINNTVRHFYCIRFPVVQSSRSGEITLAFEEKKTKEESYFAFNYLPIMEYPLPFIVNANFHLTASRQQIHWNDPWNQYLLSQIPNAFCFAVQNISYVRENLLDYLPSYTASSQWKTVAQGIMNTIRKEPCILCESGSLRTPTEVLIRSSNSQNIISNEELNFVLNKEFVSSKLDEENLKTLLNVRQFDLEILIYLLEAMQEKNVLQSKSPEWMLQMYELLLDKYEDSLNLASILESNVEKWAQLKKIFKSLYIFTLMDGSRVCLNDCHTPIYLNSHPSLTRYKIEHSLLVLNSDLSIPSSLQKKMGNVLGFKKLTLEIVINHIVQLLEDEANGNNQTFWRRMSALKNEWHQLSSQMKSNLTDRIRTKAKFPAYRNSVESRVNAEALYFPQGYLEYLVEEEKLEITLLQVDGYVENDRDGTWQPLLEKFGIMYFSPVFLPQQNTQNPIFVSLMEHCALETPNRDLFSKEIIAMLDHHWETHFSKHQNEVSFYLQNFRVNFNDQWIPVRGTFSDQKFFRVLPLQIVDLEVNNKIISSLSGQFTEFNEPALLEILKRIDSWELSNDLILNLLTNIGKNSLGNHLTEIWLPNDFRKVPLANCTFTGDEQICEILNVTILSKYYPKLKFIANQCSLYKWTIESYVTVIQSKPQDLELLQTCYSKINELLAEDTDVSTTLIPLLDYNNSLFYPKDARLYIMDDESAILFEGINHSNFAESARFLHNMYSSFENISKRFDIAKVKDNLKKKYVFRAQDRIFDPKATQMYVLGIKHSLKVFTRHFPSDEEKEYLDIVNRFSVWKTDKMESFFSLEGCGIRSKFLPELFHWNSKNAHLTLRTAESLEINFEALSTVLNHHCTVDELLLEFSSHLLQKLSKTSKETSLPVSQLNDMENDPDVIDSSTSNLLSPSGTYIEDKKFEDIESPTSTLQEDTSASEKKEKKPKKPKEAQPAPAQEASKDSVESETKVEASGNASMKPVPQADLTNEIASHYFKSVIQSLSSEVSCLEDGTALISVIDSAKRHFRRWLSKYDSRVDLKSKDSPKTWKVSLRTHSDITSNVIIPMSVREWFLAKQYTSLNGSGSDILVIVGISFAERSQKILYAVVDPMKRARANDIDMVPASYTMTYEKAKSNTKSTPSSAANQRLS